MDRSAYPQASISVVIPAYNARATIRRALLSVAGQTLRPREVIVVDDGSQDDTLVTAEGCREELRGITLLVLQQANMGAGAARNRAVRAATSDYIAFLDADDEWLPRKLQSSYARLEECSLILVAHNGWIIDQGCETYIDIAARFRAAQSDRIHGLYRRGFISTSSVVARRDCILAVGGFDERLMTGQDFDLWIKLLCRPGAAYDVFDEPLTRYYVAPTGITANTERRLANTLTIALRHVPSLRAHTGRWVLSLWFRIAAVHAEALASFGRSRRYAAAVGVLFRLPVAIARLTFAARKQFQTEMQ